MTERKPSDPGSGRRETRRPIPSGRTRHPEMDPEPIESLASASESQVLALDAINMLAAEFTGVELDADARKYFGKLIDHPCRKCPHLVLVHPEDEEGKRLSPGPLEAMPVPACAALPQWTHDPRTGMKHMHYRETWGRCVLFGITDLLDLFRSLEEQIEQLRRERQ